MHPGCFGDPEHSVVALRDHPVHALDLVRRRGVPGHGGDQFCVPAVAFEPIVEQRDGGPARHRELRFPHIGVRLRERSKSVAQNVSPVYVEVRQTGVGPRQSTEVHSSGRNAPQVAVGVGEHHPPHRLVGHLVGLRTQAHREIRVAQRRLVRRYPSMLQRPVPVSAPRQRHGEPAHGREDTSGSCGRPNRAGPALHIV